MSFRIYPKFTKGNPQPRVFLPNFWMKIMNPKMAVPKNYVQFMVPVEMTKYDVKNYLEKIYKVPVAEVRTVVISGEVKKNFKGYLIKDDDYRAAYVTLGDGHTFEYPDVYPDEIIQKRIKEDSKFLSQADEILKPGHKTKDNNRADVPSWFGI